MKKNYKKEFKTVRELLFWNYANMGMAHYALSNGKDKFDITAYMIRAKLYKGLCSGTMHLRSLYDDEKYKMQNIGCCYCHADVPLTLDHLVAKSVGGSDAGDNLVYCCKNCNSSKNNKDLILWYFEKNDIPPILILRRYLKLAYAYYDKNHLLDKNINECSDSIFRIDLLPYEFLDPLSLKL